MAVAVLRPFWISVRLNSPNVYFKGKGASHITTAIQRHLSGELDSSKHQATLSENKEEYETKLPKRFTLKKLAKYQIQKSSAVVNIDSVYVTLPKAERAVVGKVPKPRYIWKEKDWPNGFPDSPEEASTDVMAYLEQKDVFERRKRIDIPEFCAGSIVAVTRRELNSPKGVAKFVGICIAKNHWQNTLGATFILRNVIDGEPLEMRFQTYSPMIQKIEVLKHEKREHEQLHYLRDHPPSASYVDPKFKAVKYTNKPSMFKSSLKYKEDVRKWYKMTFDRKANIKN